jgi:tryptophan-rich sensory protein
MIQRVQTIWLLLAAIAGFLFTQLPTYIASSAGVVSRRFLPTENLLMFALAVLAGILGLAAIFLFKNRPLQKTISNLGSLLCVALLGIEVWQMAKFEEANPALKTSYYWGALLPIAMIIFFILAVVNIRKDEKLIKSLDRFR